MIPCIDINKENKYKSGIYCITNIIDDRIYIGSSNVISNRIREHRNRLIKGTHKNPHLQSFVSKYGIKSLQFKIIELTECNNLIELEQSYIDKYINFNKDFNICKVAGTPVTNRYLNEEDIIYISKLYNSGISCCKISEEIYGNRNKRNQISCITRGILYPEYKNLFNYRKYDQTGRIVSDTTKEKIGKANTGRVKTYSKYQIDFINENISKIGFRGVAKELKIGYKAIRKIIINIKNNLHGDNVSK